MWWGHGGPAAPQELVWPRLSCGRQGSGSFPRAPGAVLWGSGLDSGGRLEDWGAHGPSPLIWPQEPVCPWSEQLCPCGSGGLCAQADLTCPVAWASGTPVCPQHCIQVPSQAGCWAWSLWSPSVQALRLLLRLGGPCWGGREPPDLPGCLGQGVIYLFISWPESCGRWWPGQPRTSWSRAVCPPTAGSQSERGDTGSA